jgi:hypothetical protein
MESVLKSELVLKLVDLVLMELIVMDLHVFLKLLQVVLVLLKLNVLILFIV